MNPWIRRWALTFPLPIATFTFGCGSSTSGPSASTTGMTGTPTFTDVYTNVIEPNGCTVCHDATMLAGDLDMSTQALAFDHLVNVPSTTPAGETPACTGDRVVPGNAAMSLLYEKVSETMPPCGVQMPKGASPISAADMTTIKDWINAGAKNN